MAHGQGIHTTRDRSLQAVSKLANQWIEIFRAGDYGEKGTFTESHIDQIVANYQPGVHEAPAVIGHPKMDAPAYGWFDGVKRDGKILLGKMSQVQPAFAEMVESGMFKKRSAAFYKTPNGLSLRHVGFLGAMPPVVKGLADCKFADEGESVELEFQENQMADETVTAIGEFKTWIKGLMSEAKPTATAATATFSEEDVLRIAGQAVAAAVGPLQVKLDATVAEFAEREKKIGTSETSSRAVAAVAKLKAAGKWVPAFDKAGLPMVFGELAKTTETVEFGEGATKQTLAPLDALLAFMEQLPSIVPNAAVYIGQSATASGAAASKGINPGRATVDQNSVRLHDAALTFAEENKVDYIVALDKVMKKFPELTVPGGATVGAV